MLEETGIEVGTLDLFGVFSGLNCTTYIPTAMKSTLLMWFLAATASPGV